MQLGLQFRNGVRVALDLGDAVNAKTIGTAIRVVGARAAAQIRKSADRVARETTRRMQARKAKK